MFGSIIMDFRSQSILIYTIIFIFYNIQKTMRQHDFKFSQAKDQINKRRPSIELSPTLEKPIFIVTRNMNGSHILELVQQLQRQKIPYQMQQETSTLGFVLNQRFFVIVDNRYGEVTLGTDFASILMTVVGYPKKGKNMKNRYCQTTGDVVNYYRQFKNNTKKMKGEEFLHGNKEGESNVNKKIQLKSVLKYQNPDQKQDQSSKLAMKNNPIEQGQNLRLIILEDNSDPVYTHAWKQIYARCSQSQKKNMQMANEIESIRKMTLFKTNKTKIFYLTNQKYSKMLLKSIFIGQVIIFNEQQQRITLTSIVHQPKLYGIACGKSQIEKILKDIGFSENVNVRNTNSGGSNGDSTNLHKDAKETITVVEQIKKVQKEMISMQVKENLIKQRLIRQRETKQCSLLEKQQLNPAKQERVLQMIEPKCVQQQLVEKIQPTPLKVVSPGSSSRDPENQDLSIIVENSAIQSDLNASILSKISTGSKKIKRLKQVKSKIKQSKSTLELNDNSKNKENLNESIKINEESMANRKRTLKRQQSIVRSKKNLTFKEKQVILESKMKRVKSIPKMMPEVYNLETENYSTMTEDQYYPKYTIQMPTSDRRHSGFSNSQQSFMLSIKASKEESLNGIFYKQFIPKFHNIVQMIKMKPTVMFGNSRYTYLQPFVYMKQYDRFVRRLKNKLHEKNHSIQEFNFIVLLPLEQWPNFQQYCCAKNNSYDLEQYDLGNTSQTNKFSCISSTTARINIYLFLDSIENFKEECVDCGRIRIYKQKLMDDPRDTNLSKTISNMKQKIKQKGLLYLNDYNL